MSQAAIQPESSSQAEPLQIRAPRRFGARIALDVLGRWGARLGLIWIGWVAFLAVFAPLLASSHPLLMRTKDGEWSSPMLNHLSAVDVVLIVGSISAPILWRWRFAAPRRRLLAWTIVVLLTTASAIWLLRPPINVVYSQYREQVAEGEITFVLPTLIPYSPSDRLRDYSEDPRLLAPNWRHLMGTTALGEDLLTRMIHACRIALSIGFIATGIAVILGVIIGGLMGYFSGWVDLLGMRLVEIFSAIPTIFLLIAFVAFYGRNLYLIMVIIGLTSWVGYAVFTRAEFLRLRNQDFVQAAQACGLPLRSILFRHMLPNGIAPVLVNASFGVASAILAESVLSFLGLGLVEEPSWGQVLNQARGVGGSFYWWIATYPGLAIFLTVFAYNLVGEALRDAIDPHLKREAHL